jgi:hypothetical protein
VGRMAQASRAGRAPGRAQHEQGAGQVDDQVVHGRAGLRGAQPRRVRDRRAAHALHQLRHLQVLPRRSRAWRPRGVRCLSHAPQPAMR